jgi:hypothetical protein
MVGAYGMTMTADERLLLVAGYNATAVLRVSALKARSARPLAGILSDSASGQSRWR